MQPDTSGAGLGMGMLDRKADQLAAGGMAPAEKDFHFSTESYKSIPTCGHMLSLVSRSFPLPILIVHGQPH